MRGKGVKAVEMRGRIPFSNGWKSFILSPWRKGGKKVEQELQVLLKENQQLRKDNEAMLNIIAQMKVTLNRLINHYMTYSDQAPNE